MKKKQSILIIVLVSLLALVLVYNIFIKEKSNNNGWPWFNNWYDARDLDQEEQTKTLTGNDIVIETNGWVIVKEDGSISEPTVQYTKLTKGKTTVFDLKVSGATLTQINRKNVVTDYEDLPITISFPIDYELDSFVVDMQAGVLDLQGLTLKDVNITLNAGNLKIDGETITKADIRVNAGNVEIDSPLITDMSLRLDTGNINLNTKLEGENDFEVALGNFDATIPDLSTMSFDLKVNLGDLKVLGAKENTYTHAGSMHHLNVKVDVGNLEINR